MDTVQLKCLENNKNAIGFYEKHGFTKKSQGRSKDGNYILFERKIIS